MTPPVAARRNQGSNLNPHICFATVGSSTIEHVQNHAAYLEKFRISYCLQIFPNVSYSHEGTLAKIEEMKHSIKINGLRDFQEHKDLVGQKSATVLQSPYLEHYPSWLEAEMEKSSFVYLGYGISLSNWHYGHYRMPIFQKLKIRGVDNLLSYIPAKVRHWRSTKLLGDGLMQNLMHGSTASDDGLEGLLWAPHWSQSWFASAKGYSRFIDALDPILRYLGASPEHSVTFRPHPILLDAISVTLGNDSSKNREVISTAVSLDPFRAEIQRLMDSPGLRVSNQSLTKDVLQHSRLVTEGVSIIAYWGITGKPMAIWRDKDSPKFNALGTFLSLLFTRVRSAEELNVWLVENKTSSTFLQSFRKGILRAIFAVREKPPIITILRFI